MESSEDDREARRARNHAMFRVATGADATSSATPSATSLATRATSRQATTENNRQPSTHGEVLRRRTMREGAHAKNEIWNKRFGNSLFNPTAHAKRNAIAAATEREELVAAIAASLSTEEQASTPPSTSEVGSSNQSSPSISGRVRKPIAGGRLKRKRKKKAASQSPEKPHS